MLDPQPAANGIIYTVIFLHTNRPIIPVQPERNVKAQSGYDFTHKYAVET